MHNTDGDAMIDDALGQSYEPRRILPAGSLLIFVQISTTPKQNPTSTQQGRWPKFWSRIIITLLVFSFRA
jgi:hypothetical protein